MGNAVLCGCSCIWMQLYVDAVVCKCSCMWMWLYVTAVVCGCSCMENSADASHSKSDVYSCIKSKGVKSWKISEIKRLSPKHICLPDKAS